MKSYYIPLNHHCIPSKSLLYNSQNLHLHISQPTNQPESPCPSRAPWWRWTSPSRRSPRGPPWPRPISGAPRPGTCPRTCCAATRCHPGLPGWPPKSGAPMAVMWTLVNKNPMNTIPYGSKHFLRRYLSLQIIPQTLPKKVLGSIGIVISTHKS